MSASDCRRSENFLAEFGEELDRACFVENDAIVKQWIGVDDDECVYHFVVLRDSHGGKTTLKEIYPIYSHEDAEALLENLCSLLGAKYAEQVEDLKNRIEKADLL